ncbi:hypothetical protein CFI00_0140 [Nocardioides sp. S5]|nr:hypothetical protein CFI00_0140 [Nocardioides sp. S5]
MPRTIRLDGSEWSPESLQKPHTSSFAAAQWRAEARSLASPSAVLGIAAVACTAVASDARTLLRAEFGFGKARADASVRVGAALGEDSGVSTSALGYLAGVKMSGAQQWALTTMLAGSIQDTGASGATVSPTTVKRAGGPKALGRLARKGVKSADRPSQAVCAALLASRLDSNDAGLSAHGLTQVLSNTFMGPRRASATQKVTDRLLVVAYAMSGLSKTGLDLGSRRWVGATAGWRHQAAPWLLPLLDKETSPALVHLLDAARARGLKFASPGTTPFIHEDCRDVTEYMRNVAVGQASALTKWTDWPTWFGGDQSGAQVLLTQDDDYAYAWVGRGGRGQLVAFDTTDFIGWGLDEPGMTQALAYALGWYVDVSISLRASPGGSPTVRRAAGGSKAQGITYKPTPAYGTQRAGVALGHHSPPKPHMRAAHVRNLGYGTPSEEALSHAPAKFRSQMGPHETWIRSASVGGAAAQAELEPTSASTQRWRTRSD